MPYLLILIIIFLNYIIPYKGVIKLGEDEEKILSQYKSFNSNNLSKMFESKDSIMNNALDEAPTLTVLGDLNNSSDDKKEGTESGKDYEDISISKYL